MKSPFDFERNMRVYVASDVPLPSPQEAKLALDVLADYIDFCTERVRGGSLVLFTSYTDMRAVATTLEPKFAAAGRPFLMQGADLSRTELAQQMRELRQRRAFRHRQFLDRRRRARAMRLPR